MATLTFSEDRIENICGEMDDDFEVIDEFEPRYGNHDMIVRILVQNVHDHKHYIATLVRSGPDFEDFTYDTDLVEVEKKEITKTKWVAV